MWCRFIQGSLNQNSVDESTLRSDGCQVALYILWTNTSTHRQVLCNYLFYGWLREILSDWSKHLFETGVTRSLQPQVVDWGITGKIPGICRNIPTFGMRIRICSIGPIWIYSSRYFFINKYEKQEEDEYWNNKRSKYIIKTCSLIMNPLCFLFIP